MTVHHGGRRRRRCNSRRGWPRYTAALLLLSAADGSRAQGLVEGLVQRFAASDIQFTRTESDVPFLPLAWLTATGYRESRFVRPDGSSSDAVFRQTSQSEGAFLPLALGQRDALVFGEWLGTTQLRPERGNARDLNVLSVALPVGWMRQNSPDWQIAAFVAPLGSTSRGEGWYWETLGGAFARYTYSDRLAWIFGAYADLAPLEDFYIPYLGVTYTVNPHWSIDVVLPWPGVTYAPNADNFLRLGVAPSGASWSVEAGDRRPRISLSAWDLSLGAQHRLLGKLWLGVEAGVSGIRGLSVVGGEFQSLQTHIGGTGFIALTINLRPEAPAAR